MPPSRRYAITSKDRENARRLRNIWNREKKDKGLTQVKIAEKLGIKQPSFSQYLSCTTPLNTDIIFRIATALRVNPSEIDPELANVSSLFRIPRVDVAPAKLPILGSLSGKKTVQQKTFQMDISLQKPERTLAGFIVDTDDYADICHCPKGSTLIVDLGAESFTTGQKVIISMVGATDLILAMIEKLNKTTIRVTDCKSAEQRSLRRTRIRVAYPIHALLWE